jgi:hypothetical protein
MKAFAHEHWRPSLRLCFVFAWRACPARGNTALASSRICAAPGAHGDIHGSKGLQILSLRVDYRQRKMLFLPSHVIR